MSADSDRRRNGCPMCSWEGDVAHTHDSTHRYFTHVVVSDGELFRGKTCSMRTAPKRSLLSKIFGGWNGR